MILTATINEVKRRVTFDNPNAVVAVKGDYEVNGVAFAFPAIYEDDFDLSTAVKTVYYKATDGIIYNHVVTDTDTDTGYPLWVFKDEINKGAYGDVEFALVCDKVEGGNIVKRWVSMITVFRVQKSIEIDESEQEDNEQTYSERLAYLMTQMANMQATVSGLASGAPTPESLVANMQEGHIYVYTGTETGYIAGHLYYYVNGTLTDGGQYGGTAVDATLTQSGQAADAKKTGDEISAIKEDLSAVEEDSLTEIPFKQTIVNGRFIRESDGINSSNTSRARTYLIDIGNIKTISVQNPTYQMRVAYYDSTGDLSTGSGYIGSTNFVDGNITVVFPSNAAIFGASFQRVDSATLTDSDIEAIYNAVKISTNKANAALNASDGLDTKYEVIDKDSGTILNYYLTLASGEVTSSSLTVKTLCIPCKPCETYRIRHPKSTHFIVASYITYPRFRLKAQKIYSGRNETVTIFTTDEFASWLGIYYYSSSNNSLTPDETYDALKIEIVDSVTLSVTPRCYSINNAIALPTTYEEVIALYDALVATRPDYVTKNALTSGDLTNYEYVFSTGNYNKYTDARRDPDPEITKPTILLTSGVHGYERSAVVSLYLLMRDLCNDNYALTELLNYVNIRVIPVGCPWGYTHNSRLNANGVNINRNFATTAWNDYGPGTSGSSEYAGPSAGSEDETKIIQNWMQAHSDALFYVDFHNSNFMNEVVTLGGPDTEECTLFKKRFLLAINRAIPYWQKERGIDGDNNIYCYTGGSGTIDDRHSRHYAYEVGIHKAFYCETSWNVNGTGKHSIETFLVGAEAMGNFLIGMKKYYEEI